MIATNKRNTILDTLKGISIIAVALYHFGGNVLPYGYLGVDIFFVVGGYLLINQIKKQFEKGSFNYWSYIFRKAVRLWPLVILASLVSLIVGYGLMLPNDYENLAESVIASSVFANNILQCITTKNYWDIVNLYKPLMHFWYVGVLMQAYILLPIIYLIATKLGKNRDKSFKITTICVSLISLSLFLVPSFSTAWKFYYLPFRLFEITTGGLISLFSIRLSDKIKRVISFVSFALVICLLCFRHDLIGSNIKLLLIVIATTIFIYSTKDVKLEGTLSTIANAFAEIGKRSYSIYIWHQVIIAFLLYSVFPSQSWLSFIVFLVGTIAISLISYRYIEIPLGMAVKNKKTEAFVIVFSFLIAVLISGVSFYVYLHAGVVRDVPELNIERDSAHRGMHSEYCDRVYSWDRPFSEQSQTKVLVIGNSFGRDWANILSEYDQDLDISFFYYNEDRLPDIADRIEEADYVFYALGLAYGEVPSTIIEYVDSDKLYIISNKNYGASNGIIYARRNTDDYYSQTVEFRDELQEDISHNEDIWGSHFINMMNPVLTEENRIRVFTDDNRFISQDCRHLTQAGAQYYSRLLDLDGLFGKDN